MGIHILPFADRVFLFWKIFACQLAARDRRSISVLPAPACDNRRQMLLWKAFEKRPGGGLVLDPGIWFFSWSCVHRPDTAGFRLPGLSRCGWHPGFYLVSLFSKHPIRAQTDRGGGSRKRCLGSGSSSCLLDRSRVP